MGDDATHDNLVKNMVDAGGTPLQGAVCEPTDSIMSVGDVVRPQHYATFHASLTKITAPQSPWALGPPTGQERRAPRRGAAPATGPGEPRARPSAAGRRRRPRRRVRWGLLACIAPARGGLRGGADHP